MNQLGAMDASFLYMESPQTPMHAGGLCILEPRAGRDGASFHDDFRAHLARRLHLAPILGKVLAPGPLDMDHPGWVDAGSVDLDHHVRRIALPRPGSRRQLEDLVGRLHSNPLDRDRPLWEFHVVEGLEGGRTALYAKVHQAALEGDAGARLTDALFDASAEPREVEPAVVPPKAPAVAAETQAEDAPSLLEMIGSAQSSFMRQQVRALQMIPEAWQAWTRAVMPGGSAQPPAAEEADARPAHPAAPRTPLNGTVTSQRSYATRSLPLEDAVHLAQSAGVRLEDVVLAASGAALRRWLQERRALPAQPLVALVPAQPGEAAGDAAEAAAPALLVSLATDVADPLERLRAIAGSAAAAPAGGGRSGEHGGALHGGAGGRGRGGDADPAPGDRSRAANDALGGDAGEAGAGLAAAVSPHGFSILGASLLLQGSLSARGRAGRAEHAALPANVVLSTVAGPAETLYLAGAKMVAVHPVSIPTHGLGVNITAQRYDGELDIGLVACRHLLPDAAALIDYLLDGVVELKRAVDAAAAASAGAHAAAAPVAAAPAQPAATPERSAPPVDLPADVAEAPARPRDAAARARDAAAPADAAPATATAAVAADPSGAAPSRRRSAGAGAASAGSDAAPASAPAPSCSCACACSGSRDDRRSRRRGQARRGAVAQAHRRRQGVARGQGGRAAACPRRRGGGGSRGRAGRGALVRRLRR